jgi:plasmid stabilization system protein ParE
LGKRKAADHGPFILTVTPTVRFDVEAQAELDDAIDWLECQRSGLGRRFLVAVEAALGLISKFPLAGFPVPGVDDPPGVRRAPVKRFPYHVIYLLFRGDVWVLAIAHDRRRPGYWAARAAK